MNNLTLVGVLGIAGYAAYKVHDNRVRGCDATLSSHLFS